MFRVSHNGDGRGDADHVEGARQIDIDEVKRIPGIN